MPKAPLTEISKTLKRSSKAKKQLRNASGQFVSATDPNSSSVRSKNNYPPMVSVTITNPITYLKLWWKKVMEGEGIDVKLRIHPVTAIVLALIICGAGFGLGRLTFPADSPIVRYVPKLGPTPTESPYKSEAYSGVVQKSYSNGKYYLLTSGERAISLTFPSNVNPEGLIGKRILAVGRYNTKEDVLLVTDASDLEVLPQTASPVPTVEAPTITLQEERPTPTTEVPPPYYNEDI